jgi:hypothetical protein
VEESDRFGFTVEEIKGPAISDVDTEEKVLVGDKAIDAFGQEGRILRNDGHLCSVNLLGVVGFVKSEIESGFIVMMPEAGEGLLLVGGGRNVGDSLDKGGPMGRRRIEGI